MIQGRDVEQFQRSASRAERTSVTSLTIAERSGPTLAASTRPDSSNPSRSDVVFMRADSTEAWRDAVAPLVALTARDLRIVIADLKERIRVRFGIPLEEEVQYIGFE